MTETLEVMFLPRTNDFSTIIESEPHGCKGGQLRPFPHGATQRIAAIAEATRQVGTGAEIPGIRGPAVPAGQGARSRIRSGIIGSDAWWKCQTPRNSPWGRRGSHPSPRRADCVIPPPPSARPWLPSCVGQVCGLLEMPGPKGGAWSPPDPGGGGPVASARHEHVVGAVHRPVQSAFGQDGVGEQPVPVLGRTAGGHDHPASLVAVADELEEVRDTGGRELTDAEVMHNDQVGGPGSGAGGPPRSRRRGRRRGPGAGGRSRLEDVELPPAGGIAQSLGDVRLAHPHKAAEDDQRFGPPHAPGFSHGDKAARASKCTNSRVP